MKYEILMSFTLLPHISYLILHISYLIFHTLKNDKKSIEIPGRKKPRR
jgi:hypothetical protein